MPSTAVVADTTSYLPRALLDEHDIKEVSPLPSGARGSRSERADITDLHAFYERLRISDQTVTTSQPSVGDFISVYEPLLAEGKEIVSIHLSSGISGTFESAMQARERLTADGKGGERIAVCDSKTGAGGMGLMVLAAAKRCRERRRLRRRPWSARKRPARSSRSGSRSTRSTTCGAAGGSARRAPGSARRSRSSPS